MKRIEELRPLSHEHHYVLQLSWKIRTGIKKGVELERIKNYTDWFYKNLLKAHMNAELEHVFPIIGLDHKLVKKALSHHRRLNKLFNDKGSLMRSLSLIEEELETAVRFEERILFKEIQEHTTEKDLVLLKTKLKRGKFEENTSDEFWL